MSRVYDNWEKLVEATLKRELLREIALCPSLSSSSSIDLSSSFDSLDFNAVVEEEKSLPEVFSLQILLADRVIKSTQESVTFKQENEELALQITRLSQLLRSVAAIYDRPISRITYDLTKTLNRALTLTRKCRYKKTNVLRLVLSITTDADFRKVLALLDSSLANIKWVLSIFSQEYDNGIMSLPPVATNDPILAFVWSGIAAVQMGRAEGAHELASLARDNDRYKKIIVEEDGIPPLLNLLKESSNTDALNAAASALCNIADTQDRVSRIVSSGGVQVIAKALGEAPMRVQVTLTDLVSKMSEADFNVQEEFGRENVTRPLVSLLGMDVNLEEFKEVSSQRTVNDLHSLVQIKKEMTKKSFEWSKNYHSNKKDKEREAESPEVKSSLKVSCATALWKLARRSLLNSRKITETKALHVLAKIIEKERGDLQINCLMVVLELAAVAESNADLKRAAFKPTSSAAKAVFDQLLKVINEDTSVLIVTPAIKAIGCLATTFPAKETRVIEPLVAQLAHSSTDVAAEAAKALGKFVCEDNFNRNEHSKAIIEFNGVPKLMNLLRSNDRVQLRLHELILLCNLAINVGNNKSLEQARALSVLEGAARHVISRHPELRELFAKAIHQLTLYQAGARTHRQV